MKTIIYKVLIAFVACISLGGAFLLAQKSFQDIEEMRQLERIPQTQVATSVEGIVAIEATAKSGGTLLTSRLTETPSIYYRYRHEVEEKDSDGNRSWNTKEDWHKAADFILEDVTGAASVSVNEQPDEGIAWRMPHVKQITQGDHRYTEWRIVPGDQVFVFGILENDGFGHTLRFDKQGNYTPIISLYDSFEARAAKGGASILWLVLSMCALAVSVYCLVWLLNIHRLLVYLAIYSFGTFLLLLHFGLLMLSADAKAGIRYLDHQIDGANRKIKQQLLASGLPETHWDENTSFLESGPALIRSLPNASKAVSLNQSIVSLRLHVLDTHTRLINHYSHFPNRQVLWLSNKQISLPGFEPSAAELQRLNDKKLTVKQSKIEGWWTWVLPIVFSIGFVVFTWFGLRSVKTKRMIESVPTSPCKGVVYGVAEVEGVFEEGEQGMLASPLTKTDSLWYRYLVEEKRGSGKDAKWVTVTDETKFGLFYCEDATGKVLIDAANADVVTVRKNQETRGTRRYTERLLCQGDSFYGIGFANVDMSGEQLVIGSEEGVPFIVSNRSEFEVMLSKARVGIALWSFAMISALATCIILFAARGGLAPTDFMASAMVSPIVLLVMMVVLHYNDLVFLRQRAERNLSNIWVSLKKRKDLLPALVDIVDASMQHETLLHESVASARSAYQGIENSIDNVSGKPDGVVSRYLNSEKVMMGTLSVVVENYPDLKASESFKKLMFNMTSLENELAYMRAGYIDAVEVYNARCQTFPDNLLARIFRFSKKSYELID